MTAGMTPVQIQAYARQRQRARSHPRGGVGDDPALWIEEYFYIPETRGPMMLGEYQKDALRRALARGDDGLFCYSTILWSDIKKSIKSCIAAGVLLWWALQVDNADGWGSLYIIANDLKQADSRVAYYLRRAIELNPVLRGQCKVRSGTYKIILPNHTFIEAIPIDPSGEAGSNADMVVFSELWGAHSKAQSQMWTEMTLPPNKYGRSLRWVETYAGVKGGSPLLEQLYDQAVVHGQRLDQELEIYDNARLFCLWNTQPRLPWQTEAYYNQERAALLPDEFLRVHRNQWAESGAESFLPAMQLWDACEERLTPLDRYTPCILALDAGESNDTFASVIVSTHPADAARLAVRYARPYVPTPGVPLDFDEIEIEIRELGQRHAIRELAYDPFLLGQMIRRLQKPAILYRKAAPDTPLRFPAFPAPCVPFSQGAARLESDKGLLDLIMTRRIVHAGNIDLRQHVANADRKVDTLSRKLRIVKRSYPLKIDLAVALSMGAARAATLLALPDWDESALATLSTGSRL